MTVAACEDCIDGRGHTQSVCDTLWLANWATDRVHWPEQLPWNTQDTQPLHRITLLCSKYGWSHKDHTHTQIRSTLYFLYIPELLHTLIQVQTTQYNIQTFANHTHWYWPLNISMVPLLRAVSPLMGDSLQRLISAKNPARTHTHTHTHTHRCVSITFTEVAWTGFPV